MKQRDSLLKDRKVFGADVAGQGLSQDSQMGQITCPVVKCILQVLLLTQQSLFFYSAHRTLEPEQQSKHIPCSASAQSADPRGDEEEAETVVA